MPVLAELGTFPINLKIICQLIAFWIHILESNVAPTIVGGLMATVYIKKKNILYNIGLGHVWENQSTLNARKFK